MFCQFRQLWTRLLLRQRGVHSAGAIRFKCDSSAQLTVKEKFVFGVATLAEISPARLESILSLEKNSTLEIVSAAIGRGSRVKLGAGARMSVGRETYFSDECFIFVATSLSVGDGCAISRGVQFLDDDGHPIDNRPQKKPIAIGNHVWIGSQAVILKGTELGDGCVVAAGAMVCGKFPPRSLIGGVPARVIRENIQWT